MATLKVSPEHPIPKRPSPLRRNSTVASPTQTVRGRCSRTLLVMGSRSGRLPDHGPTRRSWQTRGGPPRSRTVRTGAGRAPMLHYNMLELEPPCPSPHADARSSPPPPPPSSSRSGASPGGGVAVHSAHVDPGAAGDRGRVDRAAVGRGGLG